MKGAALDRRVAGDRAAAKGRSQKNSGVREIVYAAALVIATLAAYAPALRGSFVWDDDTWTTRITPLLKDIPGLLRMWWTPNALSQYFPVSGTTFWLDYHLWGWWTLPYHVENVLLHTAGAVLFAALLRKLQVPGAMLAGAVFALHPFMVESAAWIAERKNVLSLVFYLAALLVYGRYAGLWKEEHGMRRPGEGRRLWIWSLVLFLAALLSKATTLSLPAAILLITWWKRGRLRWREDVLPTAPFFALAVIVGIGAAWMERHDVGASGPGWDIPFAERFLIAGRALWFYAGKVFWPANLCFIYPRWAPDVRSIAQWLYPVGAMGMIGALWLARGQIGRGPLAAVLFFAGSVFPLLGFFNAYFMRYSFVCDHWAYLPSLGLIALGAAVVARLAAKLHSQIPLYGVAAVVLLVFAVLTWNQSSCYANLDTLYHRILARNPDCTLAWTNLGYVRLAQKKVDEAGGDFQKAIDLNPGEPESQCGLGMVLFENGRLDEAAARYEKAIQLFPDYVRAHSNLGNVLFLKGRTADAIAEYEKALRIEPDFALAHYNLGHVLLASGRTAEAIPQFQSALDAEPDLGHAHYQLGVALSKAGRLGEAIPHLERAAELQPDFADGQSDLGAALLKMNRPGEAAIHLQRALELQPDLSEAGKNLLHAAWILATSPDPSLRNGTQAVAAALRINQLTGGTNARTLATLAAAYAETGKFTEAQAAAKQAAQLAGAQSNSALVTFIGKQVEAYRKELRIRDVGPTNATAPSPR